MDKRSLKIFFAAFGLQLRDGDYLAAAGNSSDQTYTDFSRYLNSTVHSVETNLSYQELMEIYKQLRQDLEQLSQLLYLHKANGHKANGHKANGSLPLQATEIN